MIADSLRYDSVWNEGDPALPWLNENSTTYHQAYSAGCWTLPSTASMFTGLDPHEHGATTRSRGVNQSVQTLAESLGDKGYKTVQLTANPVTTHIFGLDRGFDKIERVWRSMNPGTIPLANILVLLGKRRIRDKFLKGDFITGKMTEDIQAGQSWVHSFCQSQFQRAHEILKAATAKGQKVFLFINLMETHFPYHVSNKFQVMSRGILDKFRELKSMFHMVNQSWLANDKVYIEPRMLNLLRSRQKTSWRKFSYAIDSFSESIRDTYPDSLYIFTSDHGDNFGDEGWRYHFSNVTEAGNRVPLFVAGPEVPAGEETTTPTSIRLLKQFIVNAAETGIQPERLEPQFYDALPLLESFWYDKNGKTLSKFQSDQFGFIYDGHRYTKNGDGWHLYKLGAEDSAVIDAIPYDADPVYDLDMDKSQQNFLREKYESFRKFSRSIS